MCALYAYDDDFSKFHFILGALKLSLSVLSNRLVRRAWTVLVGLMYVVAEIIIKVCMSVCVSFCVAKCIRWHVCQLIKLISVSIIPGFN